MRELSKFALGTWVRYLADGRIGKVSRVYNIGMGEYDYAIWFPGGGCFRTDFKERDFEEVGPLDRLADVSSKK